MNKTEARAIILCSGSGIDQFLNGLLTCALPQAGAMHYGLLLNPKGRILSDLFVWCYDQDHILLDCPKSDTEVLCRELMQRNFDPNLKMTLPESLSIQTTLSKPDDDTAWSVQDARNPAMGWRSVLEETPPAEDTDYTARRLALGIPEGPEDLPRGEALPLEYGLEAAIDFTKGCFMGQEVCTRMHRMGGGKFAVRVFHSDAHVSAGAVLGNATHPKVGTIISSYGNVGFARVYCDRLDSHPRLWVSEHPKTFIKIL